MDNWEDSPNMEDIARVAGVHRTTVSMALRNHRRISRETCERIQELARNMGYRKHPLVSALMTYRAKHRKPDWRGLLGLLTLGNHPDEWLESSAYRRIHMGLQSRAQSLGYSLDPIWASQKDLSGQRLKEILRARGIHGVILTPNLQDGECRALADMDWKPFSLVAVGNSAGLPDCHRVASDYFSNLSLAYRQCVQMGYRRIGLILTALTDTRSGHLWWSSFLNEQRLHPALEGIPPLLQEDTEATDSIALKQELTQWLRKYKPDVCLTLPGVVRRYGHHLGDLSIPRDIGWVNLGCYEPEEDSSGLYPNYRNLGEAALDFLFAMMNRGETGLPVQSQTLLIRGVWVGGNTAPGISEKRKRGNKLPGRSRSRVPHRIRPQNG